MADLERLVVTQASDQLFADAGPDLPLDDPTDELLSAEHVLVADVPPVAGFAVVNGEAGIQVAPRTAMIRHLGRART